MPLTSLPAVPLKITSGLHIKHLRKVPETKN